MAGARTTRDRRRQDPQVLQVPGTSPPSPPGARRSSRPGNSVTIFDCRPPWHPNLTEWSKAGVAQLRYSASTHHWSLYWGDRNGLVALVINKEEQVFGGGFATMARALLFDVPESAAAEKRFWTLKLAEATLYWTEGHENGLMPDAQFDAIMAELSKIKQMIRQLQHS